MPTRESETRNLRLFWTSVFILEQKIQILILNELKL